MNEETKDYVRWYDVCKRDKTRRRKKYGLLQPLDIRHQPCKSISMDFITGIPEKNGFTQILVVHYYLSNMAHFIAMVTEE